MLARAQCGALAWAAICTHPLVMDGLIDKVDGSTEMFLEHKHDIIRRLDTSMACGDGVNNTSALTKMDIDITVDDKRKKAPSASNII